MSLKRSVEEEQREIDNLFNDSLGPLNILAVLIAGLGFLVGLFYRCIKKD